MADNTVYRASTTAPVNIAVVKYAPASPQRRGSHGLTAASQVLGQT